MTQYAAGSKTLVDNGREKRTDGLHKHLGMSDVGTLRVTSDLTGSLLTGHGVETCMGAGPPLTGIIQALDRDAAAGSRYCDLIIGARNITISPQQGGALSLPSGSITTPMLASNAVQEFKTAWTGSSNWKLPSTSAWVITDIRVNNTFSGALCRIEFDLCLHSGGVAGSNNLYVSIGLDGAVWSANLGMFEFLNTDHYGHLGGRIYVTPPTGSHEISIFLLGAAGTGLSSQNLSRLYITEQKR